HIRCHGQCQACCVVQGGPHTRNQVAKTWLFGRLSALVRERLLFPESKPRGREILRSAQDDISIHPPNAFNPVMSRPTINVWMSCVPSYVETLSRFIMCRITEYLSVMPAAPRMSRALRAHCSAIRTLFRLAREICAGRAVPASIKRVRRSASNCAL